MKKSQNSGQRTGRVILALAHNVTDPEGRTQNKPKWEPRQSLQETRNLKPSSRPPELLCSSYHSHLYDEACYQDQQAGQAHLSPLHPPRSPAAADRMAG